MQETVVEVVEEVVQEKDALVSVSTGPLLYFMIIIFLLIFLYEKGKKKYDNMITPLNKKEHSLKKLYPMGFAVLQMIKYSYSHSFDRKLRKELKEIYSIDYIEYYLRIYWAKAMTYGVLGLAISGILTVAADDMLTGLIIGAVLVSLLPYSVFQSLEKTINRRHMEIAMQLPEFVNQVVILTGAGMTLQGALDRVAERGNKSKVLYCELDTVMNNIREGISADEAFSQLSTRCNTPEMRRLISTILQNMYRGGTDTSHILKGIGDELWNTRKANALRIAEEASTKLLFPMMLMMGAVMLMVLVPAIKTISL